MCAENSDAAGERTVKFGKLPKWAQREIRRLEGNERHLRAALAVGPEDSNTFVGMSSGEEDRKPLGTGTLIAFGEVNGWDRFQVRLGDDGETLIVMGGEMLAVEPRASNVVHLRSKRHGA